MDDEQIHGQIEQLVTEEASRFRSWRASLDVVPAIASLRARAEEIRAAEPALTLHDILKRHPDLRVDVDLQDRGVVRDVDRPEDLQAR